VVVSAEGPSRDLGKTVVVAKDVRGMTNLLFTHHARERMEERGVTEGDVYSAANEPDDRYHSPKQRGSMIAEKQLETGHTLRVVYRVQGELYVIITVIKMSRRQRASR
jgi:Domain of unknown function (DUF4258)